MRDIPQWFRDLTEFSPEREVQEKWREYEGFREDGYRKDWILVRIGLADPEWDEE